MVGLIVLLSSCTATGSLYNAKVMTKYDKFSQETTFITNSSRLHGGGLNSHFIWVKGVATVEGHKAVPPDYYDLEFISKSFHWKFLNNYNLFLIIDGQHYKIPENHIATRHKTMPAAYQFGGVQVKEILMVPVKPQLFKKLAFSKHVSGRLGIFKLDMSYERRKILRLLAYKTNLVDRPTVPSQN